MRGVPPNVRFFEEFYAGWPYRAATFKFGAGVGVLHSPNRRHNSPTRGQAAYDWKYRMGKYLYVPAGVRRLRIYFGVFYLRRCRHSPSDGRGAGRAEGRGPFLLSKLAARPPN